MISHAHGDHMGSLSHVYSQLPKPKPIVYFNYPQKRVCDAEPDDWGCDPLEISNAFKGVPYKPLLEGDSITLGNFQMKVLAARYEGSRDENDESIIMMVTHKPSGNTLLHTGDANKRVGRYVVDNYNIKTDVLMLPHHGCKGQPDDDFYREADPHIAVWQSTVRALNERLDICSHTHELLNEMKVPIRLWQWKLPNARIDFPIKGIPKKSASIMPIIMMLLLDD